MYKSSKARGFTLMEVMIVVVILSVLAGIAFQQYGRYAFRARRADGKELLMRVAAAQERYYTNFNRYAPNPLTAATSLGLSTLLSEKGYYQIVSANGLTGDNQSYELTITPVLTTSQKDDLCNPMSIDNTGLKKPPRGTPANANGDCW